jgi:hypothetical protein
LPRRQRPQPAHDLVPILDGREVIGRRRERQRFAGGEGRAAETVPEQVHRYPKEVGIRILQAGDALPSLPDLEERVLHDLLGLGAVAGHETKRAEERSAMGLEEVLERCGLLQGGLEPSWERWLHRAS